MRLEQEPRKKISNEHAEGRDIRRDDDGTEVTDHFAVGIHTQVLRGIPFGRLNDSADTSIQPGPVHQRLIEYQSSEIVARARADRQAFLACATILASPMATQRI